ncbi:hypothetical protein BU26DRAFT_579011, partial [Trematosphaeria pertusa]
YAVAIGRCIYKIFFALRIIGYCVSLRASCHALALQPSSLRNREAQQMEAGEGRIRTGEISLGVLKKASAQLIRKDIVSYIHIEDRPQALKFAAGDADGTHHYGCPVRLGCYIAPFLRLFECVGQGIVDDSVVVVGQWNGRVTNVSPSHLATAPQLRDGLAERYTSLLGIP